MGGKRTFIATTTGHIERDDGSAIAFQTDAVPAVWGRRKLVRSRLVDADLVMNRRVPWQAGPAYPSNAEYDLETTVLHGWAISPAIPAMPETAPSRRWSKVCGRANGGGRAETGTSGAAAMAQLLQQRSAAPQRVVQPHTAPTAPSRNGVSSMSRAWKASRLGRDPRQEASREAGSAGSAAMTAAIPVKHFILSSALAEFLALPSTVEAKSCGRTSNGLAVIANKATSCPFAKRVGNTGHEDQSGRAAPRACGAFLRPPYGCAVP